MEMVLTHERLGGLAALCLAGSALPSCYEKGGLPDLPMQQRCFPFFKRHTKLAKKERRLV